MNPTPKNQNIVVKTANETITIDIVSLNNAKDVIRAINHPLRKEIIQLLNAKKELNMGEIQIALRMEQSVTSQQLGILRKANILTSRTSGKERYYTINQYTIERLGYLVAELSRLVK